MGEETSDESETVAIEEKAMLTQKDVDDDFYENLNIHPMYESRSQQRSFKWSELSKKTSTIDMKCSI